MADVNVKIKKGYAMLNKNLPEEVIADILSRIPVKSLLRFKSVCKSWYALIIDPAFVKMHLSRSLASNTHLNLILSDSSLYSVDLDSSEPQELVKLDHQPMFLNHVAEIVGSCNGLLCVNYSYDIFLWNPSTRRHHKVPFTPTSSFPCSILCGFGYDPITEDYKVVRVVIYDDVSEVRVYSLSTDSWRRPTTDMLICIRDQSLSLPGVLVNSALHWLAESGTTSNFIVSFDLRDEEWREVTLPDFVDGEFDMAVRVLEGQLCLVCGFWNDRVEFWVMKNYGVTESWVKQFSIERQLLENSLFIRPICYSKNGEVILEMYSHELNVHDTCRGRSWNLITVQYCIQTEIYIESLVPLSAKEGTEEAENEKEEEAEEEKE